MMRAPGVPQIVTYSHKRETAIGPESALETRFACNKRLRRRLRLPRLRGPTAVERPPRRKDRLLPARERTVIAARRPRRACPRPLGGTKDLKRTEL